MPHQPSDRSSGTHTGREPEFGPSLLPACRAARATRELRAIMGVITKRSNACGTASHHSVHPRQGQHNLVPRRIWRRTASPAFPPCGTMLTPASEHSRTIAAICCLFLGSAAHIARPRTQVTPVFVIGFELASSGHDVLSIPRSTANLAEDQSGSYHLCI